VQSLLRCHILATLWPKICSGRSTSLLHTSAIYHVFLSMMCITCRRVLRQETKQWTRESVLGGRTQSAIN